MFRLFKGNGKGIVIDTKEGFTLLEVLISIVIMTVAMLAMAAGEVTSLSTGQGSREMSLAAASGQEILERMRRNKTNLLSYNGFDTDNLATRPVAVGMLRTDYDEWRINVQRVQGGRGVIQVASGTPIASTDRVTVTITIPSRTTVPSRTITLQAVF